jgi:uncharacterized repeat protein (TIGR04076 family)
MPSEMPKCKITVIRRTINRQLIEEYLDDKYHDMKPCELLKEGQEFVLDRFYRAPEGFCDWAWADIRRDILTLAYGGDMPGMRKPGTLIVGCTDWFRPVIFKLERLDSSHDKL